jgi:hypothetical protein
MTQRHTFAGNGITTGRPIIGFGVSNLTPLVSMCIEAYGVYVHGSRRSAVYMPGARATQVYTPGSEATAIYKPGADVGVYVPGSEATQVGC